MKKVMKIEGMSCSHCTGAVTKALEETPGVSNVQVSLESKEACFDIEEGKVTDAALKDLIEDLGYDVEEIA